MGPDFMTAIGALALFSPAKPNGISFDLNDLGEHNFPIEHDASLSRQDYYYNHDDLNFYTPNYDDFIGHFAGQTMTSAATSAAARYQRINASLTGNPTTVYGPEGLSLVTLSVLRLTGPSLPLQLRRVRPIHTNYGLVAISTGRSRRVRAQPVPAGTSAVRAGVAAEPAADHACHARRVCDGSVCAHAGEVAPRNRGPDRRHLRAVPGGLSGGAKQDDGRGNLAMRTDGLHDAGCNLGLGYSCIYALIFLLVIYVTCFEPENKIIVNSWVGASLWKRASQ